MNATKRLFSLVLTALCLVVLPSFAALPYATNIEKAPTTAQIVASTNQAIAIGFKSDALEFKQVEQENQTRVLHDMPGEGAAYELGQPILPAVSRVIIVPPDAGLEFRYENSQPERVRAERKPVICDDKDLLELEGAMPEQMDVYPPVVAAIGEPFIIRGVRMVRVTTYPVQYDASTEEFIYNSDIKTEIKYTAAEPVNPVRNPRRMQRSRDFMKVLDALAINTDQLRRDDETWGDVSPFLGHYLVVIHEDLVDRDYDNDEDDYYDAWEWIEWKKKSGYKVDILAIPDNRGNNAGYIEDAIQDAYDAYVDSGLEPFDQITIIGDHDQYDSMSGEAAEVGEVVRSPQGTPLWGSQAHADYFYACLEGDDVYADVGISRITAGSDRTMSLWMGRTMAYEAYPYMDDTDWFNRAASYGQRWGGNYNLGLVGGPRWGKEVLKRCGYQDVWYQENYEIAESQGTYVGPFIKDFLNEGGSIMIGRAENYHWRSGPTGLQENVAFPIDLNYAGHHEWTCWHQTRTGDGDDLKGPVAATTGWGGPSTFAMTVAWMELCNAMLSYDIPLGWSRSLSVFVTDFYLPANWNPRGGSDYNKTDCVAYGDSGILPWIGVPRIVDGEFTETVTPLTRLIEGYVYDEDGEPVSGAQVTFYAPGDMPDPDDEDYVTYNGYLQITKKSDNDGYVAFSVPENFELENRTEMYVTITGRDIVPEFIEWTIEYTREGTIEILDYAIDGGVVPGAELELSVTVVNTANSADYSDVTVELVSLSPWLSVGEDAVAEVGDMDAGEEVELQTTFTLTFDQACPDGASRPQTRPVLMLVFRDGDDNEWRTGIEFDPEAPNFEVVEVVDSDILEDGLGDVNILVKNIGRLAAGATATLKPLEGGVSVSRNEAEVPELDPGEDDDLAGYPFTAAPNLIVPPGSRYLMAVIFETEDGFIDSSFFELQAQEARENAPMGPDPYGYICLDDTDEEWELAPEFDWKEINPAEDFAFRGTELAFEGRSYNLNGFSLGEAIVIDLGFTTQFYGREYDQITVASCGFISPGDQGGVPEDEGDDINDITDDGVTNYQNFPMDRCIGGGAGMIAPFWDNLEMDNNSGIFYYYNEDEAYGIIEWFELGHSSGNASLTFQVFLYDKEIWGTATGDQNIIFQYKEISQSQGTGADWDSRSPYASVGISSPDGNSGLSYTWRNQYPVNAAELENGRALLFSTSPEFRSGSINGRVIDYRTQQGLPGVNIITQHGFASVTDDSGYYEILESLAGIEFCLTASKPGYNDSTKCGLWIDEDSTLVIDYAILHPEFSPSTQLLSTYQDSGITTQLHLTLENTGNGPLQWEMIRHLPRGADVEPWVHREGVEASTVVDNPWLNAVIFANNQFLVAGDDPERNGIEHKIFKISKDGEALGSFSQPNPDESTRGIQDMTWDKASQTIYAGINRQVFAMDTAGNVSDTIDIDAIGGYSSKIQAIAWDEDNELLWLGAVVSDIYAFDLDGNVQHRIDRQGLRLYGMTFWPDSPDGYDLMIMSTGANQQPVIYRMNPEDGDTMFVTALVPPDSLETGASGIFATNQFDVYSWVMMHMAPDGSNDRIDIWQLEARRDWFKLFDGELEAEAGRVDATRDLDFVLNLNSDDLTKGVTFEGYLDFYHNAVEANHRITVQMEVIEDEPPGEFNLLIPADGDTLNPVFADTLQFDWEVAVDRNYNQEAYYELWFANGIDSAKVDADISVSSFTADVIELSEEIQISLDVETPLTWWVVAVSDEDRVLSNQRNALNVVPNDIQNNPELPVEFGLQSIYPSPFNSTTTVRFGVDKNVRTKLQVYDLLGRKVTTLFDKTPEIGNYAIAWNATALPSGLYIVQLESAGRTRNSKVALVR